MLWMYNNDRRRYLSHDIQQKLQRASDTDRQRRSISRSACREVLKKSLHHLDDAINRPHLYESIININGKDNICYVPLPRRELINEENTDEGVEVKYDGSQDGEDREVVQIPLAPCCQFQDCSKGSV